MLTLQQRSAVEMGYFINQQPWSVFATFTTDRQLKDKAARRLIERLHTTIESRVQNPLTTFWVAERYRGENDFHLHALFHAERDVESMIYQVKNSWEIVSRRKGEQAHNRSTIEPFNPLLGGTHYVTKSLAERDAEYDIFLPGFL